MNTILIFTGGDPPGAGIIEDLPPPDLVLAADGGYDTALALGYRVDVLVGDFDSLQATELPGHVIVERHPEDKDRTDLDLAMTSALGEDPARIVVVGGSGGRHDHELAIADLICSNRWQAVEEIDWFTARSRAHVIRGRRTLHGDVGELLTLLPWGGDCYGVTTRGLRWELAGEVLEAGVTRGVSNVLRMPVVEIHVEIGCLLAVMPLT